MTSSAIAIRNVYVMMAYAFKSIHSEGAARISAEAFDHLHDLFAEILVRGIGTQVKRGLHHDYVHRSEELATVRGRIDISRTAASRSLLRGKLVSEFDSYESNTPHNQALKCVMILLVRHGDIAPNRRDALRRLLPYLDGVTLVSPTSIRWNRLTYHRSNASYRLLLGVCELVVRGLLPTPDTGNLKLTSWISDEAMSSLYERFLREYFSVHHPELSPRASGVAWDYEVQDAVGAEQLPVMRTDVTLRWKHQTLIIDAKYYNQSMQVGRWGKSTIHSAHLYQLLAYVKNADVHRNGSVGGLLLYAGTDTPKQPDLGIVVQGNHIGARSLDLDQPWEHIAAKLEEIADWIRT